MSEAVLQERERNVTGDREHGHTSEPDFETMEIPSIDINSKSKQEVVEQGESRASSDTVSEGGQRRISGGYQIARHTAREHVWKDGQMWDRAGQTDCNSQDIILVL